MALCSGPLKWPPCHMYIRDPLPYLYRGIDLEGPLITGKGPSTLLLLQTHTIINLMKHITDNTHKKQIQLFVIHC